jgi:very-short-patch-repair endonuclease
VKTERGTYAIDFVVRSKTNDEPRGVVAIELDGHDFHEKTKEQVAQDKKRERAIVKAGLPMLRFSGHEIWKNTRACVLEVADYFRSPTT